MYGQLNIFSILILEENKFNPIEYYAKCGSGFVGGKDRIINFFMKNRKSKERADFLKNEYGIGGFGIPCDKPFIVHHGWSDGKGCRIKYYDDNMNEITIKITYVKLAETIGNMIDENRY